MANGVLSIGERADEQLQAVRSRLGDQIRQRVTGSSAGGTFHLEPGPRWFADDAAIRVVHGDASMFVGGLRALLLQSLHPLAMAGVAQHSDFRSDPWGRLQRTAEFLGATTFGTIEHAERAIAIVQKVHQRVVGVAADGRPYSANDPHLLGWVHVAELDSFIAAHRRHGVSPMGRDGYDEYVDQAAVIAQHLGVVNPPRSVAELQRTMREYRRELRGTPDARAAARYLLLQPPLPLASRPAYAVLAAAAVALLPAWARFPLRVPLLPVTERLVVRQAGSAITQVIRWAVAEPTG